MKVVQVNSTVNWGSTGRIAEDIGLLIQKEDWESYIAYGRDSNPSNSETIKIGSNWDYKIHGLWTRLCDRHGFGSLEATRKFLEELDQIKPDIIHLHNIHGYYINIELLFDYIKKKKIPIIWTLHDCWPMTGHCAHFDYIGCKKWKTQCCNCPQKSSYPATLLFSQAKRNFFDKKKLFTGVNNMHLVTVSHWLRDIVKESFLKDIPCHVIHNGIDLNIFKKQDSDLKERHGIKEKKILLGVANQWDARKGIQDFIELNRIIDPSFQIVLVGVSKKIKDMLSKSIIAIERTQDIKELAAWYSVADVFINPTYEDNFPTTNLEALACGTPVITYKTGGSIEAVDEKTGFIVDKGDISGINKVLEALSPENLIDFERACRFRAETFYNKQDRYRDYMQIYKKIIKK